MREAKLRLEEVRQSYGGKRVLDGVTFEVPDGELVAVLGPSGCGKTTLLKAIAGLVPISGGSIVIGGRSMEGVPPRERNAAMIFQQYALFPHMTVAENLTYGLKVRGVGAAERGERANELLARLKMEGFGQRAVHTLSGGQQQRVAIGRALAVDPDVLLLDEPLSNLDERLRLRMRREIRSILKERGGTSLYVTHDQDEAMEIADRIVVMREGAVEQIALPGELWSNPKSEYVARFLGHENILDVEVTRGRVALFGGAFDVPSVRGADRRAKLLIPATAIRFRREADAAADGARLQAKGVVEEVERLTTVVNYRVGTGGLSLKAIDLNRGAAGQFELRQNVQIEIDTAALRILG